MNDKKKRIYLLFYSRLIAKLNHTHTIGDLRQYIES